MSEENAAVGLMKRAKQDDVLFARAEILHQMLMV
jgi:hypothetical protein